MKLVLFICSLTLSTAIADSKKFDINVREGICWALCRNDGYNSGYYETKKKICSCVREINYREFTDVKFKVPVRVHVSDKDENEED